jgi:hypothetical protein
MNLKDRIFELVQDTYGLDVETIAARLQVSWDEARRAVEEMLVEERLWETSEGTYRCVLPPPPWLRAVKESLDCDGWPGLSYSYLPEDRHLEIFPVGFVSEGHKEDGVCFMTDWLLDLNRLLELFDGRPTIQFGGNGVHGTSISIEGAIQGKEAWIEILDRPPADLPPDLLMTRDGGFRQLTEEEQNEYEATHSGEEDDDDDDDNEQPPLRGRWAPSEN